MLPLRDRLPTRRFPLVNYTLIVLNVLSFLWMGTLMSAGYEPDRLLRTWGLVPHRLVDHPLETWPTIFTSMFMHDPTGWMHLGGNMLFLWIFGDNVEDALGKLRYAVFYVLVGIAAAAAQILTDPTSPIPMVGASGAIAGVLAAYASLYPRSSITVLNPFFPLWLFFGVFLELPAWLVILEFFVANLLSGIGAIGMRSGGVAFFAHLGGFVAGLIMVRFFTVGRPTLQHERWQQWRTPPRRTPEVWNAPRRRGPGGW